VKSGAGRKGILISFVFALVLACLVAPAIAEENDTLSITGETTLEEDIDLTIGGLVNTVPAVAVFCNVPTTIRIMNLKNNGTDAAENIVIAVYDDAVSSTEPVATTTVASLAGGATKTITLADPTIRGVEGGTVTYRAVVDPENLIPETNESNNEKSSFPKPLKYNGYMGAQYWTGKEEIETYRTYDLHGDIIHSFGNSSYRSGSFGTGGWTEYAVGWAADNLTIPDGATVREARLYVPYCWDNSNEISNVTITFNGAAITCEHREVDQSNFGAYDDHWYGLMTYNVTDEFNANEENTVTFTRITPNAKISPAGFTLAVVYDDPLATRKQIFINEGWDLLGADGAGYGTTEEQATSYQEVTGMTIDMADAGNAMLTTFVPWGAPVNTSDPGEGNLFVNGVLVGQNVWNYGEQTIGESDSAQVAVDTRDILDYLNPVGTGNVIGIQSTAGSTPAMVAERSFLVVEYPSEAPTAAFTGTPTSGDKPLTVEFTDESTGTITEREWDFGDGGNSTDRNPVHTYTAAGTYTVNLTVSTGSGSDTLSRPGYITVTVKGDFNGNDAVDVGDVSKVAYMVVGKTAANLAADFNQNGAIDIGDAAKIAYYFVGKIPAL